MKNLLLVLSLGFGLLACGQTEQLHKEAQSEMNPIETDGYWKDSLTSEEYRILRDHGTERPFTGEYLSYKGNETFVCRACKLPLFEGNTKFKSGTGWPSFFNHVGDNVETQSDNSHGMSRNEIHCKRCKGHLGHIFKDGPAPTGNRYCVNSLSILLENEAK